MAMNFLSREPRLSWTADAPRIRLLRWPANSGLGVGCGRDAPGGTRRVARTRPEKAPTCAGRAQGARPGRGAQARGGSAGTAWARGAAIVPRAARFQPRGLGSRLFARLGSRRVRRPRRRQQQARRRRLRRRRRRRRCLRAARVSSSRRASAGEARGGRERGSPASVPGDPRGGRGAPLHAAPCDRRSGAAGAGEPHADDSCCSALRRGLPPSRPPASRAVHPRPPGASSPGPGEGVGAPPQRRVLARGSPGPRARSPRVITALVAGCAAAHAVLGACW